MMNGSGRKTRTWGAAALLFGGLLLSSALSVQGEEAERRLQQRSDFLAAKQAIEAGETEGLGETFARLEDYPLYPYLVYWQMRQDIDTQSPASIQAFVARHADSPLAGQLRAAWLRHLAAAERWPEYLEAYQGSQSAALRCHFHTAQLESGKLTEAWSGAEQLWLVGNSQHRACDGLFAAWEKAGQLTPALRWRRIELAMGAGNTDLAAFLARGLDEAERSQATLWIRVHNDPRLLAEPKALEADSPRARRIALHGLRRLASADPEHAAEVWPALGKAYRFSEAQRHSAEHAIALHLALRGNVQALEWYAALPEASFNESRRAWAVRAALRNERWQAVIAWIEKMPAKERQNEMWRYWLARAHEALDQQEQAQRLYRSVSTSRSYYGFLAADRLGAEYNLFHEELSVSDELLAKLASNPALVRAGELYRLDLLNEARQEWDQALARMNNAERKAAGKLAASWAWHDRALLALARANHFDDLAIRFPLAYSETIASEAENQAIDPSWVYAVARQESAMDPHARSPVGAVGLMQLMPATGREIAKQLAIDISDSGALLQPETNIRFGSHYLREMLGQFSDNPVMATAAYNAGPHRVQRWYPEAASIDADIWVDTVPFHETRKYMRRVMAYAVFYDQRLERTPRRLSERMPPVSNPRTLSLCDDCPPAGDDPG